MSNDKIECRVERRVERRVECRVECRAYFTVVILQPIQNLNFCQIESLQSVFWSYRSI